MTKTKNYNEVLENILEEYKEGLQNTHATAGTDFVFDRRGDIIGNSNRLFLNLDLYDMGVLGNNFIFNEHVQKVIHVENEELTRMLYENLKERNYFDFEKDFKGAEDKDFIDDNKWIEENTPDLITAYNENEGDAYHTLKEEIDSRNYYYIDFYDLEDSVLVEDSIELYLDGIREIGKIYVKKDDNFEENMRKVIDNILYFLD